MRTGTYVFVLEKAEHFNFAKDPSTGDEVLENIGNFFQCHHLAIARIRHRPAEKADVVVCLEIGVLLRKLVFAAMGMKRVAKRGRFREKI